MHVLNRGNLFQNRNRFFAERNPFLSERDGIFSERGPVRFRTGPFFQNGADVSPKLGEWFETFVYQVAESAAFASGCVGSVVYMKGCASALIHLWI